MATHTLNSSYANPAVVKTMENLLSASPVFDAYIEPSLQRTLLESYISEQFATVYDAKLHDFMPLLLALSCQDEFCAASGIRLADTNNLFLEQYLPQSIETVLSNRMGHTVTRQHIAEIGNLASTKPGASQLLFIALTVILEASHLEWVTFTATPPVQKAIERLGIPLYQFCDANPLLLKNSSLTDWGSYYEQKPKVVAAQLSEAMNILKKQSSYNRVLTLQKNEFHTLSTTIILKCEANGKSTYAA